MYEIAEKATTDLVVVVLTVFSVALFVSALGRIV